MTGTFQCQMTKNKKKKKNFKKKKKKNFFCKFLIKIYL